MRGICKQFPGVRALHEVDFTLKKGEILGLIGENGAGKSTLMKVLTAVYPHDAGTITFNGEPLNLKKPGEAYHKGISIIFQELNLCPNLSAMENIFLGKEVHSPQTKLLSYAKMR